jgi:branched-chain amino acid transport system substrate-binding protein
MAVTRAGEILAFEIDDLTGIGPYSMYPRTSAIEANQVVNLVGGPYRAPNYRARARSIRSDCFVWTGEIESNGNQVLKDVGRGAPNVKRLFSGDGNCLNDVNRLPTDVERRFKCTIGVLDPGEYGDKGRRFFRHFKNFMVQRHPDPYAIYGYESMKLLLDAISRASEKGTKPVTRAQVVKALFETKDYEGVTGTFSIDENGDTTLRQYGLFAVDGRGLYFDRVLTP